MKTDMTEHQVKELAKWLVDNGQRKLTKEEKEEIKLAIAQVHELNELAQVAFASLAIDSNRQVFTANRAWVQSGYNSFKTI